MLIVQLYQKNIKMKNPCFHIDIDLTLTLNTL